MSLEGTNNSGRENYLRNDHIEMWIENGILHAVYLPETVLTFEVAKRCVEDRHRVTRGKNYPMLVDVRNVAGEEKMAREYYSSEKGMANITAGAIIVKPFVPAILANIYLRINKPTVPAKVFKKVEPALNWLRIFKST